MGRDSECVSAIEMLSLYFGMYQRQEKVHSAALAVTEIRTPVCLSLTKECQAGKECLKEC